MSSICQKPSQLLSQLKIDSSPDWTQLKFTRPLQLPHGALLNKRSHQALTPEENAELDAIQELDTIIDFLNHQMAYQRHTCLR